jgi:subtilisin family serine protease
MIKRILAGIALILAQSLSISATAAPAKKDILIKFHDGIMQNSMLLDNLKGKGIRLEPILGNWVRAQGSASKLSKQVLETLENDPSVDYIQPNYTIRLLENYQIQDSLKRAAVARGLAKITKNPFPKIDNPPIIDAPAATAGPDPLAKNQWGMIDIGVQEAWKVTTGNPEMIVAVIDTGVDYAHEDLLPNLWRNSKEIPNNGIDDDKNGFIDDVIGWDFSSNDNKPYDLAVEPLELLTKGGNPGHGTHCAGNVAARGDNSIGIAGVAPNVKIMALRFISEKGSGTTADAIKAIKYAVDNGAKVLSNSWGSEGEDPNEGTENKALRDAVTYAMDHDVLFIAAAGNGHKGVGYDNDTDSAPGYPASYAIDNIISVAAIDANDKLGSFSNWGLNSVHLGAPGVNVYSTTVGSNYDNFVINVGGFEVTWDGTSMATPHVAGAAALYWSAHPEKKWKDVKTALLATTRAIPSLKGKTVSGGKLDVGALLK